MLRYLLSRASERKLRLHACACCRHLWPLLRDDRAHKALEAAERYAEGEGHRAGLRRARRAVRAARQRLPVQDQGRAEWTAYRAVEVAAAENAFWGAAADAERAALLMAAERGAPRRPLQVPLFHDICGTPFRPSPLDPAWLTSTVTVLAHAAYQERALPSGLLDPSRLAVLADALEEAGCMDK